MITGPILVVAAHADDEVLGCGGTLARHAADGCDVHVLILADGMTARDAAYTPNARDDEIAAREATAREAARILGIHSLTFARLPDNRCDTVPLLDVAKTVEERVAAVNPVIVYTHHANDLNVDHRIAHQAVLTACRPLPGSSVRAIYAFETASSTEWEPANLGRAFHPTRFVDVAAFMESKLVAIKAYDCEMRQFPHPRSAKALEAQAIWRGAQAGLHAAEAFVVVREVD